MLWMVLGFIMSGYEAFQLDNSLIADSYTATDEMHKDAAGSLDQAKQDMNSKVSASAKFTYSYCEYLAALFLKQCCCCCKRTSLYQRKLEQFYNYTAASSSLKTELDMHRLLKNLRLTEFMSLLTLKSHQRLLVNLFKRYTVQNSDPNKLKSSAHTDFTQSSHQDVSGSLISRSLN